MKRIYIAIYALLICCNTSTVHAQIISVAELGMLSIKSGTIVSVNQLQVIPSADYSISDNMLSFGTNPASNSDVANINRVFTFSKTISSFKGQFKLNYQNNELNGLSEAGLKFSYNNGTTWTVDNNSTVDVPNTQVQSSILNSVSIKELSVGKAFIVPLLAVTPSIQTICSGSSITPIVLSDINNEVGTTYSWTRDNVANITGISASSGSLQSIRGVFTNNTSTAKVTTFTIRATNSKGSSIKTVALTVTPALVIGKQPEARTIYNNSNTYFKVEPIGDDLAYQWQYSSNNGGSWSNLTNNAMYAGVTTTRLGVSKVSLMMNGYLYRCVVLNNNCGVPVTSSSAKLTVKESSSVISTFIIYASPNPSPNAFRVYVSAPGYEYVDILLTDLRGNIIKSMKIKPEESILLGEDLAGAIYILIARQGSRVATTRVIKL